MAKADLTKVRIVGFRKHYKILMQELHRSGTMEVIENKEFVAASTATKILDHFGVFDLARLDFVINFLGPYADAKSKLDALLSGGKLVLSESQAKTRLKEFGVNAEALITQCETLEERLIKAKNELQKIPVWRKLLSAVGALNSTIESEYDTRNTKTWIGKIGADQKNDFLEMLSSESNLLDVRILGATKKQVYVRITVYHELVEKIEKILDTFTFENLDFTAEFGEFKGTTPPEVDKILEKKYKSCEKEVFYCESDLKNLATHLEDFKILYDYNAWRKTKNDLQQKIFLSEKIFAFEAWVMESTGEELKKWIKNSFVGEVVVEAAEQGEDEVAPILLKNKYGIESMEAITEMYGLPQGKEFDPTPLMAPFFLVFFGLCLSDVGYGSILAIITGILLAFGQFSEPAKKNLRLILYCGIAAVFGGVLLGGYFGMTPDQFSLLQNATTGNFYGQVLTPTEGKGPITFLIIALALGVLQLFFGMLVAFVQQIKNRDYDGAFLDTLAWMFMIGTLIVLGLADKIGVEKVSVQYLAISAAVILVFTQGRDQKNWLLKPVFGVLGLYNITSYLSDILSYSRIMALGLATGVVGFAMNLTAGIFSDMMPHPVLGILVAIVILVLGHSLNFALSLLGAFIHSGRLQFIEFFGKFYEGGGKKFQPFLRQPKYLFLKKD